jgi:hypothetical protein
MPKRSLKLARASVVTSFAGEISGAISSMPKPVK